ncbi:MAG: proteasome assembly chaperone family protein [Crenarchaeota archaeon]|nr:proteasome assembly chaperone family protein [Thermoproteota archaeon]
MAQIEVKIRKIEKDPRNTLVIACPEPSLASVVTVEYIIDKLKMEEIGAIKITGVPPIITAVDGAAKLPYRLFYRRDLGLITIRQHVPIPMELYGQFIERILDWAEENNIRRVIAITSIPAVSETETEDVYFVTEEYYVDEFKSLGFQPIKDAIIAGAEAMFLDSVLSRSIVGALIMAESKVLTAIKKLVESGKVTSHRDVMYILGQTVGQLGPDVTAAIKLIRAISKLVNYEIPLDNLEEHARKYSSLIEKNLELWLRPQKETTTSPLVY